MTSFKKQIPEYRELIDDSLNKVLSASSQSSKELNLAMAYSVLNGGKRIRPLMMIASAKTLDIDIQEVIPFAASIELLHSFSLIHDDLPCMDDDSIRRGKPSTHIKFGESTAVLAGNSLLTMAFEILSHKDLKFSETSNQSISRKRQNTKINNITPTKDPTSVGTEKNLGLNDLGDKGSFDI